LVYNGHTNGTVAANTFAELDQFNLNSPYLPCSPIGGGAAATGFSKYMAVYSKCFVLGARFKANYQSAPTSGTFYPAHWGITINTTTTAPSSLDAVISNGLTMHNWIFQNPDHESFTNSVDIGKFLDKPKVLDDPQLFCTVSAAPTQLIVAHLWASDFSAVGSISWFFTLEIEFDCVFTDPIPFT
jgi:hypothetical protein